MDTTIPAVTPQSGEVVQSYGPNCVVLDKPLNISQEQIAKGVDLTLTLLDGEAVSCRIGTVSSAHVQPPSVNNPDPAMGAVVTLSPGFRFAPAPETPWSVTAAAQNGA